MRDLIERLEKATGPDRGLDADIASAIGWAPGPHYRRCSDDSWRLVIPGHTEHEAISSVTWPPLYTASIDAALTLVPPDCSWVVHGPWTDGTFCAGCATSIGGAWDDDLTGATPALALCLAVMRARLKTADQHE